MLTPTLNILLADDDKDDCFLFQDVLEGLSMSTTFHAVHDGEQLMRYLTERMNKLPSVLFLDLNMPRKSGFACLEEIKRSKNLKEIPVIILSTSYDEENANQLYKSGAYNYICKPAAFSHLKNVIEHSLQLISKEKISQPPKERFLLRNSKTMLR